MFPHAPVPSTRTVPHTPAMDTRVSIDLEKAYRYPSVSHYPRVKYRCNPLCRKLILARAATPWDMQGLNVYIRKPARTANPKRGCEYYAHISLETASDNMQAAMSPVPVPAPTTTQAVSASIYLVKIANWDGTSQDIKQVLTTAFDARDYLDCIKDLRARNIEPLSYINNLDKVCSRSIS